MTQQSPRYGSFTLPTRRRPARFARLCCEQVECRVTPAVFNPQQALTFPLGTMNNNGCVAVADFDNNGRADAVFTNYGQSLDDTTGNTIVILYGRTTGGFDRVQLQTGGTNVSFVSVADINSDSFPDLLVSNGNNQNIGSVSVFRNNGAGDLIRVGTPFQTSGNNASWVGASDVTGDGILDVVVANFGRTVNTGGENDVTGNKITIFQGNADGQGHGDFTFSTTPVVTLAPQTSGIVAFVPTSLGVADFDGDGIVDIAAVSQGIPPDFGEPYPEGILYLFKGTGGGGFDAPNTIDTGGVLPVNIQAADINGDGSRDLVISNAGDPGDTTNLGFGWANSSVTVFRNVSSPGNLQFSIPNIIPTNCRGTFATTIADFNLDGRVDIASINFGAPTQNALGIPVANPVNAFVSLYLQSSTQAGVFTPASPGTFDTQTGQAGGQYLAAGDFDGNGTADLIVAHGTIPDVYTNFKVGLLVNTAAPSIRPAIEGTPVVNAGQTNLTQRSKVTSIKVSFNTQVTFAGTVAAAFGLSRIGGGQVGGFTATATVVNGKTEVTLTGFTGAETQFGSLADGRYTVLVRANQVTAGGLQLDGNGDGTSGDDYSLNGTVANGLYRLYGDGNADGVINAADFGPFRGAFGASTGQTAYLDWLDVNGDGVINAFDFGQFRTRFGSSVP